VVPGCNHNAVMISQAMTQAGLAMHATRAGTQGAKKSKNERLFDEGAGRAAPIQRRAGADS
jgi:hypothetical protein